MMEVQVLFPFDFQIRLFCSRRLLEIIPKNAVVFFSDESHLASSQQTKHALVRAFVYGVRFLMTLLPLLIFSRTIKIAPWHPIGMSAC